MWRLIPLLVLIVVAAGVALTFLVVAPAIRRRDARLAREVARKARLADYQQDTALEDLERTRERINRDQDGYYTERSRHLDDTA